MNINEVTYSINKYLNDLEPDKVAVAFITLMVSALVCVVLLNTDGNILAATGFVASITILLIMFYRVDWGFFVFFLMVLLFDEHRIRGFESITYDADYFKNFKENSHIPSFSAGIINPVELQLILLLLAWFVAISIRKRTKIQHVQEWGLAFVFLLSLILSFVNGMKSGGELLPALWEIRALFYFGFLFFIVPQVIQTERQLKTLMWVFIAVVSVKALQGSIRFAELGFTMSGFETLTNHEDPVFITLLIIFLFSLILLKADVKQSNVLLLLMSLLALGFFAGQRRAAYAGLFISFLAFIVLLHGKERLKILKFLLPLIFIGVIYLIVFWKSDNKIASPIKLVKTAIDDDSQGERFLSNIYRDFERYNLAYTVQTSSPVTGVGFGNKYKNYIPLPEIPFPLRDYIPHNAILWVIVKSGAIGFFIFWLFFNTIIFRCSSLYTKLQSPYLKSVCILIVVAILNQMVVSFYDLQLTFYRNMIVLGTFCGLLPTLTNLNKKLKPAV
ncbi:MAG: O-antigen ligase family protein [Ignavibacteriales bacterium]